MSNEGRVRRNTRTRGRKPALDTENPTLTTIDLDAYDDDVIISSPRARAPCENRANGGTSTHARSQERREDNPTLTTIDLDAYDDDVIISSPRACAEAKNNSRRDHEITIVVDLDREGMSSRRKRTRFSTSQTNHDIVINLDESCSYSMENRSHIARMSPHPPPQPPPQPPTFTCPVCMGTLVEETSTKCGHIFCKACIEASIAAQKKCPTCRRKLSLRDTIRIYLPNTNNA